MERWFTTGEFATAPRFQTVARLIVGDITPHFLFLISNSLLISAHEIFSRIGIITIGV
jgi:hypothetical protein